MPPLAAPSTPPLRRAWSLATALAGAVLVGCADEPVAPLPAAPAGGAPRALTANAGGLAVEAGADWAVLNGVRIANGGFGSALVVDPKDANYVYLLTDRGPNYTAPTGLAFPLPAFAPQIARFRLSGDSLLRDRVIPLRRSGAFALNGQPLATLTGLPLPPGAGSTGEVPVTIDGVPLPNDPEGIDSEGLVALADGTFWISDEYGPTLLHVGADGATLDRVSPFSAARPVPLVFARRRPNRGMEGLAALDGGRILVGMMQSPLDNFIPANGVGQATVRNGTATRILWYDTRTGETRQYVYALEAGGLLNSEIAALGAESFLVLERDGNFPVGGVGFKRVYRVDLRGATDVSDDAAFGAAGRATGRLYGARTLEELTPAEREAAGIVPVAKTLVADILQLVPSYPHDKAEGLAVIDDHTIAVSNDDDFGVTDAVGALATKTLPGTGAPDANRVYVLPLAASLVSTPPAVAQLRTDPAAGPFRVGAKECGGRYTVCLRFAVTDPDGAGDAPFRTVVDWGDGAAWAPNVIPAAGVPLLAPHDYAAPGDYTVRVTATDRTGAAATATLALRVEP